MAQWSFNLRVNHFNPTKLLPVVSGPFLQSALSTPNSEARKSDGKCLMPGQIGNPNENETGTDHRTRLASLRFQVVLCGVESVCSWFEAPITNCPKIGMDLFWWVFCRGHILREITTLWCTFGSSDVRKAKNGAFDVTPWFGSRMLVCSFLRSPPSFWL